MFSRFDRKAKELRDDYSALNEAQETYENVIASGAPDRDRIVCRMNRDNKVQQITEKYGIPPSQDRSTRRWF